MDTQVMWYRFVMESTLQYSEELLIHATTWKKIKIIMLNERNQTKRAILYYSTNIKYYKMQTNA